MNANSKIYESAVEIERMIDLFIHSERVATSELASGSAGQVVDQNYNYNLINYYMCVSNTIDFTLYTGFPITGPGYIPDGGFTFVDIDDVSFDVSFDDVASVPMSESKKKSVLTEINFDILFAQGSCAHIFSKEYLAFIQFCLSTVVSMDAESVGKFMTSPMES
jgi:hypothetical protein